MSASLVEAEDGPPPFRVRLYVAGDGPNSARAVANLYGALAELGRSPRDVEIIDVLRAPDRGLRDGVLVTPMLVRASPLPERRILGNLSDRSILHGLLSSQGESHE